MEGVRAKQGRKNEGPSSALLQRYITLLTHFGDPATDLDSFAGPPERSSATLKWSVAEEPQPGILAYLYARLPPPSRWPREQTVANFRPSSLRVFLSVLIRVHLWPIFVLWVSRSHGPRDLATDEHRSTRIKTKRQPPAAAEVRLHQFSTLLSRTRSETPALSNSKKCKTLV